MNFEERLNLLNPPHAHGNYQSISNYHIKSRLLFYQIIIFFSVYLKFTQRYC